MTTAETLTAPRTLILPAGAAVVVGGLVAVQSLINGRLAEELGGGLRGGIDTAVVSFSVGWTILAVTTLVVPRFRRGLVAIARAVRAGVLRPWQLVGGAAGALLVASQGLTVGTIGVALFTVAIVAGQTVSGLLVDRAGLGPAGVKPVTVARLLGALLAVVAVGLTAAQRLGGVGALSAVALALAALPLLAGAGTAFQQAVNGQVSVVGGPIPAALTNFVVGTSLLWLTAVVVHLSVDGVTGPLPSPLGSQLWLYLGGPIGVVFIAMAAVLVRRLGVLVLGLCSVAGQVVTALLLDLATGAGAVGPLTVAGAVLIVVGLAVAARGTPRLRPAR